MNESDFNRLVDAQLLRIEEALDACDVDIDYENAGGILTLRFANGSQIVINRQTPVRQIWVAARSGGFHFDYAADAGQWRRDSDGRELMALLGELASAQAGEAVVLG
ncbi:MAG: iron donor protein CyaY [Thiohalomonadaceae bacterium]